MISWVGPRYIRNLSLTFEHSKLKVTAQRLVKAHEVEPPTKMANAGLWALLLEVSLWWSLPRGSLNRLQRFNDVLFGHDFMFSRSPVRDLKSSNTFFTGTCVHPGKKSTRLSLWTGNLQWASAPSHAKWGLHTWTGCNNSYQGFHMNPSSLAGPGSEALRRLATSFRRPGLRSALIGQKRGDQVPGWPSPGCPYSMAAQESDMPMPVIPKAKMGKTIPGRAVEFPVQWMWYDRLGNPSIHFVGQKPHLYLGPARRNRDLDPTWLGLAFGFRITGFGFQRHRGHSG